MKRLLCVLILAAPLRWAFAAEAKPAEAKAPATPMPAAAVPQPPAPPETVQPEAPKTPPKATAGSPVPGVAVVSPSPAAVAAFGTDADSTAVPPVDRLRFVTPQGPAPLVGYAPQAGAPLPAYPGLPASVGGVPGYPSRTPGSGQLSNLFTDLKACGVGDVVTIIITQQAVAAANADKNSTRGVSAKLDKGSGILNFIPSLGLSLSNSSTGSTKDTSSFNVATTFTATVVAVQPNGNLVVEGQQKVNMDGRDQWVKIHGEVRPYDVHPDNSIESTKVANVQIEFVGVRAQGKRKGLFDVVGGALETLFGWLF